MVQRRAGTVIKKSDEKAGGSGGAGNVQMAQAKYGVCTKLGVNYGKYYKLLTGEYVGQLNQQTLRQACTRDEDYTCSDNWCSSKNITSEGNESTEKANTDSMGQSQMQLNVDSNDTNDNGIKSFGEAGNIVSPTEEIEDYRDPNDISTYADNKDTIDFAGEYDESTNNPNKTYKNTYWINKTKNNLLIPEKLRNRFWTHIQAGFLTEPDKKTNYNIRAIGDDDYPQTHFGTIDNGIDESDVEFIGDISEYNSAELSERVLENSYHRINTVYREYRKEIVNLSGGNIIKEKKYDIYFNNPQTKIFTHSFNTKNISVNFFSNTSETSMDRWSSISYEIINDNQVQVTYSSDGNNGHSVLTTITNLSESSDNDVYEVGNLKEGYIYKPHYRIKIKNFDSIITILDDDDRFVEIPSYAIISSSKTVNEITINSYKYRRLLDIGETDILGGGIEYPFKSGAHYLYLDMNFFLQRQDPPFDNFNEVVEMTLPSHKNLFNYLVKSPNYENFLVSDGATIDNDVLDGDKSPVDISLLLNQSEGIYSLGERYFSGIKLNVSPVKTKRINNVC